MSRREYITIAWLFLLLSYINSMHQKPTIIHIDTPINKKCVLITITFDYGHAKESDKYFGLGHLTEHVIVSTIKNIYKPKDIWGHIDNYYMVINILTDKHEAEKILDDDIYKTISNIIKNIDEKIFNNEKDRTKIEIFEKNKRKFIYFSEFVRTKIIIAPKNICRNTELQFKNLSKFTFDDVCNCIQDLIKSNIVVFVGSNNNKLKNPINKNNKLSKRIKVKTKKPGRIIINSERKDGKPNNFIFAFLTPNLENPVSDRFAMGFLYEKIRRLFNEEMHNYGSYDTYSEYYLNNDYGLIWFASSTFSSLNKKVVDSIFKIINESVDDFKDLPLLKKDKINKINNGWKNGFDRQEWIVEDYLEIGKILDRDHVLKELKKVNKNTIKKIAKKYLNRDNIYIIS